MNADQEFEARVQEAAKGAVKKAVAQAVKEALTANEEAVKGLAQIVEVQREALIGTIRVHEELRAEFEAFRASHVEASAELTAKVDSMEEKVGARNRSAAVKKNMTDADAMNVLIGEAAEMPHKEAAEKLGLTYAQVYSCRLEYTFKHVLKELRDGGWENGWISKK